MPRIRHRVPREANGRRSRAKASIASATYFADETEREATAVAFGARARLFGVTDGRVSDPRLGTMVGRMAAVGELSTDQYDAAVWWEKARLSALRAVDAPGLPQEPREGNSGISDQEIANARQRASVAKWEAIGKHLGYDAHQTLELFIVHEQYVTRLVPLLRRALDRVDEWLRKAR